MEDFNKELSGTKLPLENVVADLMLNNASILALLDTVLDLQLRILKNQENVTTEELNKEVNTLIDKNYSKRMKRVMEPFEKNKK